jgi:hypothetical protein
MAIGLVSWTGGLILVNKLNRDLALELSVLLKEWKQLT